MLYAIAYTDEAIWAAAPEGPDCLRQLQAQVGEWQDPEHPLWGTDALRIEDGITLTNDPAESDDVRFISPGGRCGWIMDEQGNTYDYAVKRA